MQKQQDNKCKKRKTFEKNEFLSFFFPSMCSLFRFILSFFLSVLHASACLSFFLLSLSLSFFQFVLCVFLSVVRTGSSVFFAYLYSLSC